MEEKDINYRSYYISDNSKVHCFSEKNGKITPIDLTVTPGEIEELNNEAGKVEMDIYKIKDKQLKSEIKEKAQTIRDKMEKKIEEGDPAVLLESYGNDENYMRSSCIENEYSDSHFFDETKEFLSQLHENDEIKYLAEGGFGRIYLYKNLIFKVGKSSRGFIRNHHRFPTDFVQYVNILQRCDLSRINVHLATIHNYTVRDDKNDLFNGTSGAICMEKIHRPTEEVLNKIEEGICGTETKKESEECLKLVENILSHRNIMIQVCFGASESMSVLLGINDLLIIFGEETLLGMAKDMGIFYHMLHIVSLNDGNDVEFYLTYSEDKGFYMVVSDLGMSITYDQFEDIDIDFLLSNSFSSNIGIPYAPKNSTDPLKQKIYESFKNGYINGNGDVSEVQQSNAKYVLEIWELRHIK